MCAKAKREKTINSAGETSEVWNGRNCLVSRLVMKLAEEPQAGSYQTTLSVLPRAASGVPGVHQEPQIHTASLGVVKLL